MRKLLSIAIAVTFFISACTKIESTSIGAGLIPPIDGVTTLDTSLDVYTSNFLDPLGDSSKVYKTDDHVIGVINTDPVFGKTNASAFFELKPTNFPFSLPNATTVSPDSAVLVLSYKGVFGDTTVNQDWEVLELAESLRGDTVFNTNKTVATGPVLGRTSIQISRLKDFVNNLFENSNNEIRIRLNQSFAKRLMKEYDSSSTGAYANDSLFRLAFKGFAVRPASGSNGNALIRVNLSDTNTKLALYYTYKPTDATKDTSVSYFRFSNGSGFVPVSGNANLIKRDRNGSEIMSFVNTNKNDNFVYIQTTPGTFATIKIPGLKGFPNSLIHRAELLTFQAPDVLPISTYNLTAPRYLLLSAYDSVNYMKTNIPNDFIVSGGTPNISTFGGYIMEKNVDPYGIVKAYSFDISRYVQGIVTRKDSSYTLRLSAPSNDSVRYTPPYPQPNTPSTYFVVPSVANNLADGRVRLGGGALPRQNQLRMRLRIVYSKL